MRLIRDHVLVKADPDNDNISLKDGKKLWIDTTFEPAKHAVVRGTVVEVPQQLSKRLKTKMELEVGDVVLYHYLVEESAGKEGRVFMDGDDRMVFVHYESLFVALRKGIVIGNSDVADGGSECTVIKVGTSLHVVRPQDFDSNASAENVERCLDENRLPIPLNGYVLVEGLKMPQNEKIGTIFIPGSAMDEYNRHYGVIRYLGTPLEGQKEEYAVGQVVMLSEMADIPLENEMHQKYFKGSRMYRVERGSIEGIVLDERITEQVVFKEA